MNRTKIIVFGLLAAVVGLLAVGSIQLMKSLASAQEAREARDASYSRLKTLYESKPFPSVENAKLMREDVQALDQMRAVLTNALVVRNVPMPSLSPSRFIQELQTTLRDRLQPQAPIIEGVRVVPDNFAFGFDRYMTAGAPLPSEAAVPRLAQQLVIIEQIVQEVYAAKLGALRRITREDFDEASTGTEESGSRVGGRRARRDQSDSSSAGSIRTPYYSAQRLTIEVAGRQAAIGDLLNRLAAMKMFVTVTDVELRKSGEDLIPPPTLANAPSAISGLSVTAAAEEDMVSKLAPGKRLVSGEGVDPPINARIELEVVSFEKEGV